MLSFLPQQNNFVFSTVELWDLVFPDLLQSIPGQERPFGLSNVKEK